MSGAAVRRVQRLTLPAVLSAALGAAAFAQAPQSSVTAPGAGAITGTVVDSATGQPVTGAIVQIEGGPLREDYHIRQISDGQGRFAFLRLANAGTYRVSVTKFGYLGGGYGREASHEDPLRNITLREGSWIGNLRVPIFKPGEISGVVRTEAGEPVVGVYVRAYGKTFIAGHERLAAGPITITDDRGHYRLGRLMPGRYVLQVPSIQMSAPASATPVLKDEAAIAAQGEQQLIIGRFPLPPPNAGAARMVYPPAFHPRAISVSDAAEMPLGFGEARAGIDITLTPVRAVSVSGRVTGPSDALANRTVRLVARGMDGLGLGSESASALVAPDGSFSFLNVPTGDYTLEAPQSLTEPLLDATQRQSGLQLPRPFAPVAVRPAPTAELIIDGAGVPFGAVNAGPAYSGRMRLIVGSSDASGVILPLVRLATVTGRIVIEADAPSDSRRSPAIASTTLTLDAADGRRTHSAPRFSLVSSASRPFPVDTGSTPANVFEVPGVEPGQYWFRVPGEWLVKSVTWRGREYASMPLEVAGSDVTDVVVTITNQRPTIAGVVRAPDGSNPGAVAVVAFPADRAARLNTGTQPTTLVSAVAGESGNFWLAGMPPGDYLVAAVPQALLHDWRSPARLEEFERVATRTTVRWGQTVTLELIRSIR